MSSAADKRNIANVVVVGLDNSGKTTIVNRLKPSETQIMDIGPTVGINVERFQIKSLQLTTFDMSGQERYRNLWEQCYRNCHGIIFVLDSARNLRFGVAKDELDQLLVHPEIVNRRIPILIFASKMDLRDSVSADKCSTLLDLPRIENKPWHIQACNAITGEGLDEGITWLTNQFTNSAEGTGNSNVDVAGLGNIGEATIVSQLTLSKTQDMHEVPAVYSSAIEFGIKSPGAIPCKVIYFRINEKEIVSFTSATRLCLLKSVMLTERPFSEDENENPLVLMSTFFGLTSGIATLNKNRVDYECTFPVDKDDTVELYLTYPGVVSVKVVVFYDKEFILPVILRSPRVLLPDNSHDAAPPTKVSRTISN